MPPSAAEREALLLARQALVVLQPDVASLRDAQQAKRLIDATIGAGRVLTVLNRATMAGALKAEMIQQGLGSKPEFIIPDMSKQLIRSANLGRPALKESAALRRALTPLTQEVSGVDLRPAGSRLAKLFRRN